MFLFNNSCPCNNRNDRYVRCRCCEKTECREHSHCGEMRCKCNDNKPSCGNEMKQHGCGCSQQVYCCKCRKVQYCNGRDGYDAYDD